MKIHGQELWADVVVAGELQADVERVRGALRSGAAALGATVLSEHVQSFEPSGITAVVVIGESHLIASTYEELEIVAVNIQTCTLAMDLVRGLEAVCDALGSEEVRELLVIRRLDVPMRVTLHAERVAVRGGRLQLEVGGASSSGFSATSAIR
jgi:S-adenosylmethionine decarboxylase